MKGKKKAVLLWVLLLFLAPRQKCCFKFQIQPNTSLEVASVIVDTLLERIYTPQFLKVKDRKLKNESLI